MRPIAATSWLIEPIASQFMKTSLRRLSGRRMLACPASTHRRALPRGFADHAIALRRERDLDMKVRPQERQRFLRLYERPARERGESARLVVDQPACLGDAEVRREPLEIV